MTQQSKSYDASDIQVLEGLEPVRLRPGMYIGGTDEKAWHHLPVEIMDNSIDEAVAGFAKKITVNLIDAKTIEIADDGRGIPVDEHPKYPGKSALEVILTTLHSGGKFNNNVYKTSGGLHGVGSAVVNALTSEMIVTICRDGYEWRQSFPAGFRAGRLNAVPKRARTGPKSALHWMMTSLGRGRSLNRSRFIAWPGPRRFCPAALKSIGIATRHY